MTIGVKVSESLLAKFKAQAESGEWSPKMCAIVGCIIDQDWTQPRLVAIRRTSDNVVLAMEAGDVGFNHFIGAYSDLLKNWTGFLRVAGLTKDEQAEAEALFQAALLRGLNM